MIGAGSDGAKNLAGKCPPPDSNPFSDAELPKTYSGWSRRKCQVWPDRPHRDATSTIQIVCPSPSGFAEIVSGDLPVLHAQCFSLTILSHLRRGIVHFELCAHFLKASGECVNLLRF